MTPIRRTVQSDIMTPERERDVERICQTALDHTGSERDTFLAEACGGDHDLYRAVESLLAHEDAASRFLDMPAVTLAGRALEGFGDALQTDQRIGPYTIVARLGAGGMGEVYRARDAQLSRDVAIKVLPAFFTSDPNRIARVEREAHVLASLNHPNIAAIHGIERADGICALVLEMVEGETLAARLGRGTLSLDASLEIALQIADALEAAHDRGIVHCDLKPSNIMIRPDGHVKVLDFGVARHSSDDAAGSQPDVPTAAIESTRPGLLLGTAPYVSPEQARGEAIDRRSDVWAFGCVLFEMLTGRSPFRGPTVAESLAKVIDGHADFTLLPPDTPPSTRRLLRLCLEPSRRGRLQHMGDARVDISDARAHAADDRSIASHAVPSTLGLSASMWAAVGAAMVALGSVVGWYAGSRPAPRGEAAVVRFSVTREGAGVTPTARSTAISPDGSRLAYVAGGRLWIRRMGEMNAVRVPGTEGSGGEPFFSPDGEWVAFFESNTGLQRVRVSGGAPLTVVVNAGRQMGGSWGTDGRIIFADGVGLFTVAADGGAAQLLASPATARGEVRYAWPQILPGGRTVLFTILRDTIAAAEIAVLDLTTKQHTVLLRGGHAARYVPTGHMIYAAGGQLQGVVLDPDALKVRGEPVPLGTVRMAETVGSATADFDVSQTGTLIYVAPTQNRAQVMTWVDRHGREDAVGAPAANYFYPRISPDGTRVALDVATTNRDIWVWNLAREVMIRITDGPTEDIMPAWSTDGKRVFFASDGAGVFGIFARSADGAGPVRPVYQGPENYMPFSSPDPGRLLVFAQGPTARAGDLAVLHLRTPTQLEPLVATEYREGSGHVSPDGRWVAYSSNESGRAEIYVRSFPDIERRKELVSRGGGQHPIWGRAGSNELYYRAIDGSMRAVAVTLTPDLTVGETTDLFANQSYAFNPVGTTSYAVSPRDGRFLMLKEQATEGLGPINVVVNWFEELTRLMPIP